MQADEKPQFARVLTGLAAVKPGKGLTPEALEIYWLSLSDWTLTDFRQAAGQLAKTCEFMPNPFHFEQLRKASRPTAGEAFASAVQWCASSNYRNGNHPDPLVHAAVMAVGGYAVIAMCEPEKLHFVERRFAGHYENLQDVRETREAVQMMTRRISGAVEISAILSDGRRLPSAGYLLPANGFEVP